MTIISPGAPEHLVVPLGQIPKVHKKGMTEQFKLHQDTWLRKVWHAFCSKGNEEIADQYFNNSRFNSAVPEPKHFDLLAEDFRTFKTNVHECVLERFKTSAIETAAEIGIKTFHNNGIEMAIGHNFNFLAQELGRRLDNAVDKEDLVELKSLLRHVYSILYGDHTTGRVGDSWKSKALFDDLSKRIRGSIIESAGGGVQVCNPLSEIFTKVYESARQTVTNNLHGVTVLKQESRQADAKIGKLDHFYVKFNVTREKEGYGMKAWRLFHEGEGDDLRQAERLLVQARAFLVNSHPVAAQSLAILISNLNTHSNGGDGRGSELNIFCFVALYVDQF